MPHQMLSGDHKVLCGPRLPGAVGGQTILCISVLSPLLASTVPVLLVVSTLDAGTNYMLLECQA